MSDITDSKRASDLANSLLHEKEALIKEVHHRVKNNLQLITSLVRLEAGRGENLETKMVLKELEGRIMSIAILHETLCYSDNVSKVDLADYIQKLTKYLFQSLVEDSSTIQLDLDLVPVQLEMNQAISCGLLINELVTNCLKHGFPDGRNGRVSIGLHPVDGGSQLCLSVSDNGLDLPVDFETKRVESLGMQIVSDLTTQLKGKLETFSGPGVAFEVTFPPAHSHQPYFG
jgi:two-component sensor histidine kinase